MLSLFTMLFSTLGATGMGSFLKIVAGIIDSRAAAHEAKEKRKLARELQLNKAAMEFQNTVFGQATSDEALYARETRRTVAIIGMLNFFVITVLCTLYPSHQLITFTLPEQRENLEILWGLITFPSRAPITAIITTGHIALAGVHSLAAIIGFYFTPGGRK